MSDERDWAQLKALGEHMPQTDAARADEAQARALAELLKLDRDVENCYYAWLGVSESADDTDNPEYRAWENAMSRFGAMAGQYIESYVHRYCFSGNSHPKGFQADALLTRARDIMEGQ